MSKHTPEGAGLMPERIVIDASTLLDMLIWPLACRGVVLTRRRVRLTGVVTIDVLDDEPAASVPRRAEEP